MPSSLLMQVITHVTSRESYKVHHGKHHDKAHACPFLASPVDPEAYKWLQRRRKHDPLVAGKVKRSGSVKEFEDEQGTASHLAKRIFRKQHEASSLELFFDLFFVANLATFTTYHAHVDAQTVANYIGFFTILWTTWFHVSMYDVRFHVDCIWSRMFHLACFLAMASFVSLGQVYYTLSNGGQTRAFTGLALVLMALRFLLAVQYGLVLFFVWGFRRTLLPLIMTSIVYLLSGFAFLVTYLVDRRTDMTGVQGSQHVIRWYIILAIEIVATMTISCFWRVLSFRHTHIVERIGLLTLIVIGEGILGLLKSIAYDLMGRNASVWEEVGMVVSAVVLIYFIYVLYFNNIDHDHGEDRFGSVRQQVWILLHYPLHVAILLTVEGQTALFIWNNCRRAIMWFSIRLPSLQDPGLGFSTNAELITAVNATLDATASKFHYHNLYDHYDPTDDLAKLSNSTYEFGSPLWINSTGAVLSKMSSYVQYFIFVNFQAKGPLQIEKEMDPAVKVLLYNEAFGVVFEYFYISAGALLLMLALMQIFAKSRLRSDEWYSIGNRIIVGFALPFLSIISFDEEPEDTRGFRYTGVGWIVPIVTLCYLGVLVTDNIIKFVATLNRHYRRKHPSKHKGRITLSESEAHLCQCQPQQVRWQDNEHNAGMESQSTLPEVPMPSIHRGPGYSSLRQHDAVDGSDLEFERQV